MNTIYVTDEQACLLLKNNNLVCKIAGERVLSVPLDNIENIVCFNYLGCSPALMGKCVEKKIPINFITPYGKFLAKIYGETKGNVFLRVKQIECFKENDLKLAKNEVIAKLYNCLKVLSRTKHDYPDIRNDQDFINIMHAIKTGMKKAETCETKDSLLGIEGSCASLYFSAFSKTMPHAKLDKTFSYRSKHPPLDPINALLSLFYSLATTDCASAIETVGLDSYIGFFHELRSGRASLACDMVEEFRAIVERFVISVVNLRMVNEKDFDKHITGAVWLNDGGRRKLLQKWQEKKRSTIYHKVIKEKIPLGLLPYVQSNLLAKYIRGEIEEYIPYLY